MINFLLFLSDTTLAILENTGEIPREVFDSDSMLTCKGFETLSSALQYVYNKLTFDDIYAFHAEDGIDYQNRIIYHKPSKK